jgi:hypothetical protein
MRQREKMRVPMTESERNASEGDDDGTEENGDENESAGCEKDLRVGDFDLARRENLPIDELHADSALAFRNDVVNLVVAANREVGARTDGCREIRVR